MSNIWKSQFGQDKFVMRLLSRAKSGYFIELGANDGITLSNSYALEKIGWHGICIEPSSKYSVLKSNRSCISDNSLVFSEAGISITWEEKQNDTLYAKIVLLGECDKEHVQIRLTKTLAEVLDKWSAPKKIQYLSLDTEGSEFEILKNFPFNRYSFSIMTIEHNHEEEKREAISKLLTTHGYHRVRSVACDDYYVYPADIRPDILFVEKVRGRFYDFARNIYRKLKKILKRSY
jgi:hypothetical protein